MVEQQRLHGRKVALGFPKMEIQMALSLLIHPIERTEHTLSEPFLVSVLSLIVPQA